MTNTIHFPGSCPYLLCLEAGPHDHPVCPQCGAVRYGNIYCPICRQYHATHDPDLLQAIVQTLATIRDQHPDEP